ncbi:hypothetical protein M8C21_001497 [Ambrosia artemisiifolia]|uniref:Uncharacterized protein n=1 Tax=Ambrosia artemisiifolia TaxID=4212 RepID=A0AAD5GMW6_AMBAR|nr:hypothetical protein M8C21_001497 [Ambrosia artemisiifolia]
MARQRRTYFHHHHHSRQNQNSHHNHVANTDHHHSHPMLVDDNCSGKSHGGNWLYWPSPQSPNTVPLPPIGAPHPPSSRPVIFYDCTLSKQTSSDKRQVNLCHLFDGFTDVWIGRPSKIVDGVTEESRPQECRLSDKTYAAQIFANIDCQNADSTVKPKMVTTVPTRLVSSEVCVYYLEYEINDGHDACIQCSTPYDVSLTKAGVAEKEPVARNTMAGHLSNSQV